MKLNIGCGRNILEGWLNVDREHLPGVDIVCNLDPPPDSLCEENSVDEFLLSHVLEHINKPLLLMERLHRIAKPGAKMVIAVPYGSSDDAWEDPTHVRPYFPGSFGYFSQPYYWRADYGYRGDWRVTKLTLRVQHRDLTLEMVKVLRNTVSEMIAVLEAVKPIRAPDKELQEPVNVELISDGS